MVAYGTRSYEDIVEKLNSSKPLDPKQVDYGEVYKVFSFNGSNNSFETLLLGPHSKIATYENSSKNERYTVLDHTVFGMVMYEEYVSGITHFLENRGDKWLIVLSHKWWL